MAAELEHIDNEGGEEITIKIKSGTHEKEYTIKRSGGTLGYIFGM